METSPGRAFLLRRKKADLIENEINRICKTTGQRMFCELEELSKATTLNNLYPKEFTGKTDTMILNAAFLVREETAGEFLSKVTILRSLHTGTGFDLEVTGPWPPFSFISIKEQTND